MTDEEKKADPLGAMLRDVPGEDREALVLILDNLDRESQLKIILKS